MSDALTLNHELTYNQLPSFTLPAWLTSLTTLHLGRNQLTSLTLPAGLMNLTWLNLYFNPLKTFVLPEPRPLTLAGTVAYLKGQGVSVYTYPLDLSLVLQQPTVPGAFGFALTGPPGVYTILSSPDLAAWIELGTLTNALGAAVFIDTQATNSSQKFYRAMTKLP
jgi:hypothetical protein